MKLYLTRVPIRHDLTFPLWKADFLCRCRLRLKLVLELFTQRRIQAKLFKEISGAPQRSGQTSHRITHHAVECGDRVQKRPRRTSKSLATCDPVSADLGGMPPSHNSRNDLRSTGLQHNRSAFGLIANPSSLLGFRNVDQLSATPRAGDASARVHFLQQAHQLGNHDRWGALKNASFGTPSGAVARHLVTIATTSAISSKLGGLHVVLTTDPISGNLAVLRGV